MSGTEWHRRPNSSKGACPICGCPVQRSGEHRAVDPAEGFTSRWMMRRKAPQGWAYKALAPMPPKREPLPRAIRISGMGPKVRAGIVQACRLLASGRTIKEATEQMGIQRSCIEDWRRRYPDLWKKALDTAVENYLAVVRQLAGTDQILL
jgi:hypothetical protein